MSITMQHERDNIYRLHVRGLLRKADFERAEDAVADEITRLGPVKLLFVLEAFEGWERQADWDASFYAEHGDSIARIAIVGLERWRTDALMFAAAGLRKGPVEFFPEDATVEALAWLSA